MASDKLFVSRNSSHFVDSLELLSRILTYLGISVSKQSSGEKRNWSKTAVKYSYSFLLHLSVIDFIIMMVASVRYFTRQVFHENVAYLVESVLAVPLWYSLFAKRELLQNLLHRLQKITKPEHDNLKIVLCINLLLLFVHAAGSVCMLVLHSNSLTCGFYFYAINTTCDSSPAILIYLSLKHFAMYVVNPLMSRVSSLLFCVVCHRCSALLRCFRQEVDGIVSKEAHTSLQPELYDRYCKICSTVREVQRVFSLASLLILTHDFVQTFILLAAALRKSTFYESALIYYTCVCVPSSVLCFMVPACAAKISFEMKKNQEMFSSLWEELSFRHDIEPLNLKVAEYLKKTKPITLSAWNMIEFSNNVVPSVFACLLTYGLLILNL